MRWVWIVCWIAITACNARRNEVAVQWIADEWDGCRVEGPADFFLAELRQVTAPDAGAVTVECAACIQNGSCPVVDDECRCGNLSLAMPTRDIPRAFAGIELGGDVRESEQYCLRVIAVDLPGDILVDGGVPIDGVVDCDCVLGKNRPPETEVRVCGISDRANPSDPDVRFDVASCEADNSGSTRDTVRQCAREVPSL